jgi:two-component system cell cycle sensor histidine kinase/response regulator CckA
MEMKMTTPPREKRYHSAREKFLGLSLESTRKSYYPQLQGQLSALRENERRMRLVTDNLPARISYVDAERCFVFINRQYEKAFGLNREQIIGQPLETVLGKDNYRLVAQHVGEALDGRHVHFETPFIGLGNQEQWLKVSFVPDRNQEGRVVGFYDLTLDLTEQKRAEETQAELETRLMHTQKMEAIGTMAGGIAHDFNNILSGIFGYTELLQLRLPQDEDTVMFLDGILKAARQARDLVQQILTFSRQAAGEPKPMAMQPVVKEALKLLASFLPSTISIRDSIAAGYDLIMGDPSQIHQIVMNLCTNAYHAMEASGGVLTVSLKTIEVGTEALQDPALSPGTYLRLEVADTGHGIPPEIRDRIFDPYFTTKTEEKGTGLGLSIIHGIVNNHGGQIQVWSKPGSGATFAVDLPVVGDPKETRAAENADGIEGGTEHILVVDDQQDVIDILQRMLEALGYGVTACSSSLEALDAFRAAPQRFDLILSDMTMPNMTGDRLAREILTIRPGTPVLLCTGFSEQLSPEKAAHIGISHVLMKPVALGDLSSAIRQALERKDKP